VHSLSEKANQNDKDKAKLQAIDYMDDGSKICLSVEIDGKEVRRESVFIHCRSSDVVLFE
jgi:hypothetical protein